MKKKKLIGLFLLSGCVLTACSITGIKKEDSQSNVENKQKSTIEASSSFIGGKLTTTKGDLTIDKVEWTHDNFEKKDGLIIWYSVTNKTKENIVPETLFSKLVIKQQDNSSEYDLTDKTTFNSARALYDYYDEKGEPIDNIEEYERLHEKMSEFNKEYTDKASAELLPNAKVQVVTGIILNNTEHSVNIKANKTTNADPNQTYIINLK